MRSADAILVAPCPSPAIAVLGASGVYGRHLIPPLTASGYRVRTLVRRPVAAGAAAACGAGIRVADIFDRDGLRTALEGCEIGVNLATSLPGPSGRGDYDANDRLRREGTPIWVSACQDAGVSRVLQQSIALVNSGTGDEWADEDTMMRSSLAAAVKAPSAVLDGVLPRLTRRTPSSSSSASAMGSPARPHDHVRAAGELLVFVQELRANPHGAIPESPDVAMTDVASLASVLLRAEC